MLGKITDVENIEKDVSMKLSGEQLLPCSIDKAWDYLMDRAILQACIPGCQTLTQSSPDTFSAVVAVKVGPVKATFNGDVRLSDLNPPYSCRISGKGQGGIAGFAEGGATMNLTAEGEMTKLSYDADTLVGGKLAQLGTRLIDSTARKLALDFFEKLQARIAASA